MVATTPSQTQWRVKMANTKFKIIALDPGITNTGWTLLEGDITTDDLTVLKMGEFHPGPTAEKKPYKEELEKFDKRTISLALLREELTKLLVQYKPDVVTTEDIFINMRRPQAYGALCMWMAIARTVCRDVAGKYLVAVPTKVAKMVTAGSGSDNKISVQQHILANKHIKFKEQEDQFHMTEHEADSIAVALALLVKHKDFIVQTVELRNGRS